MLKARELNVPERTFGYSASSRGIGPPGNAASVQERKEETTQWKTTASPCPKVSTFVACICASTHQAR